MHQDRQVILIVLDSVGTGALPDADAYGDVGSDTLGHCASAVGGLHLPHLQALGLGNLRPTGAPILGVPAIPRPCGAFGTMASQARGKDTATGHWELMGLVLDAPLQTYPEGFPPALIAAFLRAIGQDQVLGNKAASGTAILDELGEAHLRTGAPIVYTSADPVLQIAAHEERVGLETLYAWCEAAYPLAVAAGLGRVIARPFVGTAGAWRRTAGRKDYALEPPGPLVLDALASAGREVWGVGKIASIFAGRGVHRSLPTATNEEGVLRTLEAMRAREADLVFTNLVDFDMLYGHRRDPTGYARCLEAFDAALPELMAAMAPQDILLVTADHGNDPTFPGTDHTREYVPILAYGGPVPAATSLGVRATFADVGATLASALGVPWDGPLGTPFL